MKPFEGVLTFVDQPSDGIPNGARGHRVMIPRIAAQAALPSLVGVPINRHSGFETHDKETVIGVITDGWIDKKGRLHVRGKVEEDKMGRCPRSLGMSYELKNVTVRDVRSRIWILDKFHFEGAAVLKRDKAAYQSTTFTVKRRWFA